MALVPLLAAARRPVPRRAPFQVPPKGGNIAAG
jgi:hypothetical protein